MMEEARRALDEVLNPKLPIFYECKITPVPIEQVAANNPNVAFEKSTGLPVVQLEQAGFAKVEPDLQATEGPRYTPREEFEGQIENKIWLMNDVKLNRLVVAKGMVGTRTSLEEARVLAQFNHPNVATIHDIAIDNPENPWERGLYFITEYLPGESLEEWLGQDRSIEEAAEVINQIAAGLNYINQRGFVYADMKPKNVRFDGNGIPKIIDVGGSKFMHGPPDDGLVTAYTLGYAPREQINTGVCSVQTDVYSFGQTVFDILTGKMIANIADIRERSVFTESEDDLIPLRAGYRRIFEGKLELHKKLSSVIHKALQLDSQDRQQDVAQLNNELQGVFKMLNREG